MRFLDRAGFRNSYVSFVFFGLFAGDAIRYTISWWGFGFLAVVTTVLAVLLLVRAGRSGEWAWRSTPVFLAAFLLLATLSIAWSFYPGWTALAVLTTVATVAIAVSIAVICSWAQILRGLSVAFRLILVLSLVFEFVVSAFVRHPILPFWVDYGTTEKLPKLLYWSRDLLFEGGKIQGIVGNSSLLAFAALVGLIVFCVQFATKSVNRFESGFFILVAIANIALTRSATITVTLVVLAAVLLVVLALRRVGTRGAIAIYAAVVAIIVAGIVAVTQFSSTLLGLLGKSDDLTGRLGIWQAVIDLAQQRPAFGWGWISWWAPWVEPFDNLAFAAGVRQLHAHNAWLDVFMQLGVAGLVVFGLFVLSTAQRTWQFATQRVHLGHNDPGRFTVISLLPLVLLVALLVQSIAESRTLVEYGIAMLVIIAVKTKLIERPELDPQAERTPKAVA
jgi:exopolysaccharide production protein ExoQ